MNGRIHRHPWDFFIAHASVDRAAAERLYDLLHPRRKVYLEYRCLRPGDDWDRVLAQAQRSSSITLVLISSRTDAAYYQREEIAAAIALARRDPDGHRVIPIYLDGPPREPNDIPYGLRLKHGLDVISAGGLEGVARRLLELMDELVGDDPVTMLEEGPAPEPRVRLGREGAASAVRTTNPGLVTVPPERPAEAVVRPEDPTAAPRLEPFRVIVLSTDRDLGEAREQVAGYLSRAMGLETFQASAAAPPPPGPFDLAVLLLGWWWDEGAVARTFDQIDATTKVAFLADEESDWPPRRLTEQGAHDEVAQCRAGLTDPRLFQGPDELPAKVGEVAAECLEARRQRAGGSEFSLRPWERAYLASRLNVWTAGRTTSSRIYLADSDGTTELYQPALYVPLDGISPYWARGEDGRPVSQPAPRHVWISDEQRRIPLGRLVSCRALPRVVLVGAPGGGKTVFLTRLAAALAGACLGRPELWESLDLEGLRTEAGTLPLPVLLEATRLAEKVSKGTGALVEAMADELGQAGYGRPEAAALLEGLEAGRYLLLIDALDEIAEADARARVLHLLKGMAEPECFPKCRVVLTTRSARYTGALAFGPQLEVIEVARLGRTQVQSFCSHWTHHRRRDETYLANLQAAVRELADRLEPEGGEDQALTANPLMLTAICMVFERYRSLPDDRARLCALLVYDLCRSRRSEDADHRWVLEDTGKRDLLQRIALAMQEEGVQRWPVTSAERIALEGVPAIEPLRERRAMRHLQWAADHTGLLRFQQTEEGREEVRFWHRLFREYLAASRLSQQDKKVDEVVGDLWTRGFLLQPFWEDVLRLLPRALGTRERAGRLVEYLRGLADQAPEHRGRLLGLAAAAIVESRELFPGIDVRAHASEMASIYEWEGGGWPLRDRLLFLEGLGRLDPEGGDPRLREERWVPVSMPGRQAPLEVAWAPVTVQQYRCFLDAPDWLEPRYWTHVPADDWRARLASQAGALRVQARHPNWPVTNVSWYEAVAYCRWLSGRREDGRVVRLPSRLEWEAAARDPAGGRYPWGEAPPGIADEARANWSGAGVGQPSPVGAFPGGNREGLVDLIGDVWEWCLDRLGGDPAAPEWEIPGLVLPGMQRLLKGGSWVDSDESLHDAVFTASPRYRSDVAGFRVVLE